MQARPSMKTVLMFVISTGVVLAVLSSRMGPPSSVTLTLVGPQGLQAQGRVNGGHRGALPFTIELMLDPVSPQARFPWRRLLTDEVPGSEGVLLDGLEEAGEGQAPRWWVYGQRNEMAAFGGFEVLAVAADGTLLHPVELLSPQDPGSGAHRVLRLAPVGN